MGGCWRGRTERERKERAHSPSSILRDRSGEEVDLHADCRQLLWEIHTEERFQDTHIGVWLPFVPLSPFLSLIRYSLLGSLVLPDRVQQMGDTMPVPFDHRWQLVRAGTAQHKRSLLFAVRSQWALPCQGGSDGEEEDGAVKGTKGECIRRRAKDNVVTVATVGSYAEIYPGDKKTHFQCLRESSGME